MNFKNTLNKLFFTSNAAENCNKKFPKSNIVYWHFKATLCLHEPTIEPHFDNEQRQIHCG